ncbi:MAG TPA: ATP-dependent Clp protease adapter ClpS [Polyangiaceae bacterium]|jgi:ATP-dependent Clp protease adaptor protein ClpS|nr:ATP-dependent Clp protease adapter ClpS [Polyangiaceae bacterium]
MPLSPEDSPLLPLTEGAPVLLVASDADDDEEREGSVETKKREKVQKARRFKVLFHNDDYTTMEFVVLVLIKFFQKTETEATQIMLSVHHKGHGVAGIYPRDVAETKVARVTDFAKEHGMPLMVTAEPEE